MIVTTSAAARTIDGSNAAGYRYYVDNSVSPPAAVIYANTDDETRVVVLKLREGEWGLGEERSPRRQIQKAATDETQMKHG